MRQLFLILPVIAFVAACKTETSDACSADGYSWLVGKQLAAVTLPADLGARVIMPDMAVTQDFRPDRLNISVGDDGVIDRVYCG